MSLEFTVTDKIPFADHQCNPAKPGRACFCQILKVFEGSVSFLERNLWKLARNAAPVTAHLDSRATGAFQSFGRC
jgi:hypothetical protein